MRTLVLAAVASILLWQSACADSDPGLFIANIKTWAADASQPTPFGELLQADVQLGSTAGVPEQLADSSMEFELLGDKLVRVYIKEREVLGGTVSNAHLESTFVIDYTEPDVQRLVDELKARSDGRPTVAELVQFVHDAIPNKSYGRGMDIASIVARKGEGDCTEHAVLLTAVARATGWPARVAYGALLAGSADAPVGVGHAWTEIYTEQGWVLADATQLVGPGLAPPGGGLAEIRYLPLYAMANEGPGFVLGYMASMNLMPKEIHNVQAIGARAR